MKRFFSILLATLLSLSVVVSANATGLSSSEYAVKETAEAYLQSKMNTVYLGSSHATYSHAATPRTLLDILPSTTDVESDSVMAQVDENSILMFAENFSPELMCSMNRSHLSMSDLLADLQCMEDLTAYRSHVFRDQNISFSDFDAQYHFADIAIENNFAMAEVYEELNYHYSDCIDPSYELRQFNVMLLRIGDEWVIADVASDDVAFMGYFSNGYDLSAEIAAYDAAINNTDSFAAQEESDFPNEEIMLAAGNNIPYNKQNAVNYAMAYTTSSDNGTKTPSYKNDRFHWFGADCMNFCSQCVWAGFGGSNSWSDIPARYGMDNDGSNTWWCTNTGGTSSWASCSNFRTYVNASKNGTDKGLVCSNQSILGNDNTLPFSAQDLLGSVLHVQGYHNGSPVAKGHAVFVNAASGNTRDKVMVSAYNNCQKNVKLSSICPVGGNTKAIETIVPRYFRGGESGVRIWGDLLNTIVTHTATRTITGHCNQTLSTFKIELMNPNGGTVKTWTGSNTNALSGSFSNWNMSGEWIAKMTGTTTSGQTITWYQTIRVV